MTLLRSLLTSTSKPVLSSILFSEGGVVATDWSTWDGSLDSPDPMESMFDPVRGHCHSVPISSTKVLAVYAYGDPTFSLRMAVIERDAQTANNTNEVIIDNTGAFFGFPVVGKLSDTRFIVAATEFNVAQHFWLINLEGDTITIVDTATFNTITPRNNNSATIAIHSSSLAAVSFIDNATRDLYICTCSITGDTLTINGATEVWDNITADNSSTGITALTATTGIIVDLNFSILYTLTGTTPSVTDTLLHVSTSASTASCRRQSVERLNDTQALVTYRNPATGNQDVKVVTNTGGTLSDGTAVTMSPSVSTGAFPASFCPLRDGFYACGFEIGTSDYGVSIISVDGDVITLIGTDTKFLADPLNGEDHPIMHAFVDGNFAMFTLQNAFLNKYTILTA